MLDLSLPVRTVEGVELAVDDSAPHSFLVLPSAPKLAVSEGTPEIDLLRFVREGELTGGHLRLVTALPSDERALARARASLADEGRIDVEQVALRPIPVESATAQVAFLGRETTADGGLTGLVARPFGSSPAQSVSPHTAAFSIDLTANGVRLIESALSAGTAPVALIYRLQVEGLWPAQQIVVHVDWSRLYDHFSTHFKEGNLLTVTDIQRVSEQLVEDRVVSIRAVQGLVPAEGEPAPDLGPTLAWVQRTIVDTMCEPVMTLSREPAHASLGTMGEILGAGMAFAVKKRTQVERATADVDLQRHVVVKRTLTLQSHLADIGDATGRIVDAGPDHPFFERLILNVRTAQPLSDTFLDEAVVNFSYGSTSDAARITRQAPVATFDTWADRAADGTWTLQPEVTFAADAPLDPGTRLLLTAVRGQSRETTLDLAALLGLRRIDVEARADERVLIARATVRRHRTGDATVERTLTFAAGGQTTQSAWFAGSRAGDRFEAETEYLLADGRKVRVGVQPVDTRVYRLPAAFPGVLTVHFFSEDDWQDLDRVVVTVQKAPDQASGTFTFTKGGTALDVNLEMPDPSDRHFRHRSTRTWTDGRVEEEDWVQTDVPVVLVGRTSANKLVVDVSALGPELPEAGVRLIEVDLSYIDAPNQVRDIQKAVIGARADRFHWEVDLRDSNLRQYQYRVTVHRTSGDSQIGPWTTTSERLLAIPITTG